MIAGTKVFTYAEYVALGIEAPFVGPFALENRAARDAGGTGKYYLSRGMDPLGGTIHITAGITDLDGTDGSAEATISYGQTTTADASWTAIVDSDSIANCLHPDRVGWVQGVPGYNFNKPLVGVEIGLRSPDWRVLPDWWVEATLRNLAAVYAPYVVKYNWPIRLVTDRDEVQRLINKGEKVGFTYHWRLDPTNRSDPGRVSTSTETFPWDRFAALLTTRVNELRGGSTMALPSYPLVGSIKTNAFWYTLQKTMAYEGLDVTCGPTFVDAGYCVKGKHGHWEKSRHWGRRALDLSRDPRAGVPISDYEKTHLTAKALMLRDYYGVAMGVILNRPSDHKDHLHLDDGQSGYQVTGVYRYDLLGGEVVYGMTGPLVTEWQQMLKDAGISISVDGSYRLKTFWATRQAQYDWGLRGDGIVGAKSRAAARAHKKKPPTPTGPDYSSFTVAEIMEAQTLNKQAGWYVGANTLIDGSPGPNFQKSMDTGQKLLKSEGLYTGDIDLLPGPKYMKALRTYLTPPEPEPVPAAEVVRVAGSDRYLTLDAAANTFTLPEGEVMVIFADSTSDVTPASILAMRGLASIMSVRSGSNDVPAATLAAARREKPDTIVVVGGTAAVTRNAALRIAQAAKE